MSNESGDIRYNCSTDSKLRIVENQGLFIIEILTARTIKTGTIFNRTSQEIKEWDRLSYEHYEYNAMGGTMWWRTMYVPQFNSLKEAKGFVTKLKKPKKIHKA